MTFKDVRHGADLGKCSPCAPGIHNIHQVCLEGIGVRLFVKFNLRFLADTCYPPCCVLDNQF